MEKRVIITLSDLKALMPTAELEGSRWEQFATEAQDQELRPVIGDALYYDLMTKFFNTGDAMYANYQSLINGKSWTYNSETIYFDGLKPFVAYHTLAKLVKKNQVHITRYSVAKKVVQQSTPLDPREINELANDFKSSATTYKNQIDLFLSQNQTTYTKYKGTESSNKLGFRMFMG